MSAAVRRIFLMVIRLVLCCVCGVTGRMLTWHCVQVAAVQPVQRGLSEELAH